MKKIVSILSIVFIFSICLWSACFASYSFIGGANYNFLTKTLIVQNVKICQNTFYNLKFEHIISNNNDAFKFMDALPVVPSYTNNDYANPEYNIKSGLLHIPCYIPFCTYDTSIGNDSIYWFNLQLTTTLPDILFELKDFGNISNNDTDNYLNAFNNSTAYSWKDTGIDVIAGQMINIKASGSACLDGLESCASPDGVEDMPEFEGCKHGMLVGRIGSNGVKFCVGSDYSSVAQNAGRIYLAYNDSDYINNSGGYNYNIELTGSGIVEISLTWNPLEKSDDGRDIYAHYNLHMYAPAARMPGSGPIGYRSHIYMNNTNWCGNEPCDNYFHPYFMESRGMANQTIVIQPFNNGYFLNGQYHIFVHNTGSDAGATFRSNHAKINIYQAGELIDSFDPPAEGSSGQEIDTGWIWYLGIVNIDNDGVANIEKINKYEGPVEATILDFSSFPPPYFDENSVIPKE